MHLLHLKYCLLLFSLPLGVVLSAQQSAIPLDSLIRLTELPNDSVAIAAKMSLSRRYTNVDPDSANLWVESAIGHASRTGDTIAIVRGLHQQGILHQYGGRLAASLDAYFEALGLMGFRKPDGNVANLYTSIGITYLDLKEYDNALAYQRKALALDRGAHPNDLDRPYFNIANVFAQSGQLDSARHYHVLTRAALDRRQNQNPYAEYMLDYAEGQLAYETGEHRLAADRFESLLTDNRQNGNAYNRLNIINNLVFAYARLGERAKVEALVDESLQLSYQLNIPSQRIYPLQAKLILDSLSGNYAAALNTYGQLYRLNDSLVNVARAERISELENSLQVQQQERTVELLQKENDLITLRAATQRSRLHQLCIIAGLLLLILFLLYRRYRASEQARVLTEAQNVRIAEARAQAQRELEEKTLLMQEIHHRAKNNLSTIEGLLSLQLDVISEGNAAQVLQRSRDRIQSISLIHQQLYTSESAGDIDAAAYLQQLLEQLLGTEEDVDLVTDIAPVKLDLAQAVPIGLIVNEAVMNSLEHARPDRSKQERIEVSLQHDAQREELHLRIADNGSGYPAPVIETTPAAGGLFIIRGLIEQLRGRLHRFNAPGAVIEASIPYSSAVSQPLR